jgi:hypothetical protein
MTNRVRGISGIPRPYGFSLDENYVFSFSATE